MSVYSDSVIYQLSSISVCEHAFLLFFFFFLFCFICCCCCCLGFLLLFCCGFVCLFGLFFFVLFCFVLFFLFCFVLFCFVFFLVTAESVILYFTSPNTDFRVFTAMPRFYVVFKVPGQVVLSDRGNTVKNSQIDVGVCKVIDYRRIVLRYVLYHGYTSIWFGSCNSRNFHATSSKFYDFIDGRRRGGGGGGGGGEGGICTENCQLSFINKQVTVCVFITEHTYVWTHDVREKFMKHHGSLKTHNVRRRFLHS